VEQTFAFVERAAGLLDNPTLLPGRVVRWAFQGLLADLAQVQGGLGASPDPFVREAASHFLKVTQSYAPGLFHCYDGADLPRTNNALEQYFGSYRYHERRTNGRKVSTPGTVVRGSVRLIASAVSRLRPLTAADLRPRSLLAWRRLRSELDQRQETRRQQRRFRRDPKAYLASVEASVLKATLPT
jgi:hypothetical protein